MNRSTMVSNIKQLSRSTMISNCVVMVVMTLLLFDAPTGSSMLQTPKALAKQGRSHRKSEVVVVGVNAALVEVDTKYDDSRKDMTQLIHQRKRNMQSCNVCYKNLWMVTSCDNGYVEDTSLMGTFSYPLSNLPCFENMCCAESIYDCCAVDTIGNGYQSKNGTTSRMVQSSSSFTNESSSSGNNITFSTDCQECSENLYTVFECSTGKDFGKFGTFKLSEWCFKNVCCAKEMIDCCKSNKKLAAVGLVVIVVVVVVVVLIVMLSVWCCCFRKRRNGDSDNIVSSNNNNENINNNNSSNQDTAKATSTDKPAIVLEESARQTEPEVSASTVTMKDKSPDESMCEA